MPALASIPFDLWTLRRIGGLIGGFAFFCFLNILFVVVRYGGPTSLLLGGFALFEGVSGLRKARR
jgi:hypothetical protein